MDRANGIRAYAVSGLSVSIIAASVACGGNAALLSNDQEAVLTVSDANSTEDLLMALEPAREQIDEIVFEWGGVTTGFDPNVAGSSLREATVLAERFHLETVADVTADLQARLSDGKSQDVESDANALANLKQLTERSAGRPRIVRLRILLNATARAALADAPATFNEQDGPHSSATPIEGAPMEPRSLTHEAWAPASGTVSIDQTQAYNSFRFNKNPFTEVETYEHETQVYDKKFATYGGTWSSSMPSAYFDTPFLDSIFNPTVGTYSAKSLKVNFTYFTKISLKKGTSSTAQVRIKGQRGHRSPSWCWSPWCVWPDQTTGSMANFYAPSGLCWQY